MKPLLMFMGIDNKYVMCEKFPNDEEHAGLEEMWDEFIYEPYELDKNYPVGFYYAHIDVECTDRYDPTDNVAYLVIEKIEKANITSLEDYDGANKMKIKIKKSKNADTRTCDWTKVSKESLLENSKQHIQDVTQGLIFFITKLSLAARCHDFTKIESIDQFHENFTHGFKEGHDKWWKMHQTVERHHLKDEKYVQDDVNLIDIIEMITDGVMAGLARTGEYRKEEILDSLLRKAFDNTIQLLLKNVEVVEDDDRSKDN